MKGGRNCLVMVTVVVVIVAVVALQWQWQTPVILEWREEGTERSDHGTTQAVVATHFCLCYTAG